MATPSPVTPNAQAELRGLRISRTAAASSSLLLGSLLIQVSLDTLFALPRDNREPVSTSSERPDKEYQWRQ